MDRAEILAATEAERLDLCDFLDELDPPDWSVASLCPGWTVQDVVAHLTTPTRDTTLDMLKRLVKARGSFDRMTAHQACELSATFTPAEAVQRLRATAGSAHRAPGSRPMDPLLDVLVHGQDIARPLGRPRTMPPDLAVPALEHAIRSPWYGARKRFKDTKLFATDTDWCHGEGSLEVSGSTENLLLVATGRRIGVAHLAGSGVAGLAARFDSAP